MHVTDARHPEFEAVGPWAAVPVTEGFEPPDLADGCGAVHLDVLLFRAVWDRMPDPYRPRRRMLVRRATIVGGTRQTQEAAARRFGMQFRFADITACTDSALSTQQRAAVTVDGCRCVLGYGQWLVPLRAGRHEFRLITGEWTSSDPVYVDVEPAAVVAVHGRHAFGPLWPHWNATDLFTGNGATDGDLDPDAELEPGPWPDPDAELEPGREPDLDPELDSGPEPDPDPELEWGPGPVFVAREVPWAAAVPAPPADQGLIELRGYCLCPPESDCVATPAVTVDGAAVRSGRGRWLYPLEPGPHEVAATYGRTTMTFPVQVAAGTAVALELLHRPDAALTFVLGRTGDSDPKPRVDSSPVAPLPAKLRRSLAFLAFAIGVIVVIWLAQRNAL
ncbi:hypothetical protein Asera_06000 [Actinocatenispora sera]|uniref:Uncharacterized protein n=1 Tax=Actinocatenispora sera TaxID=390989 RepID=A0A810KVK1_9ACTN|nr:hypothetical protein Asera_06000 [Actinocatenispora sera]